MSITLWRGNRNLAFVVCVLELMILISLAEKEKKNKHFHAHWCCWGVIWQADVCHAYQILKKGGLKDENIIVFMYDDIAHNPENPYPGTIINHPEGSDVYHGVPKVCPWPKTTSKSIFSSGMSWAFFSLFWKFPMYALRPVTMQTFFEECSWERTVLLHEVVVVVVSSVFFCSCFHVFSLLYN